MTPQERLQRALVEVPVATPGARSAANAAPAPATICLADFHAHMPDHRYIFAPTREMWPTSSVNSRLPPMKDGVDQKGEERFITAAQWLDKYQHVEQMTWAPGWPMVIKNKLVSDGGWIEHRGCSCFNLYRPPAIKLGNAAEAQPWMDHLHRIYPDAADHIVSWLAHRVQRPGEKINHAIVLGGAQGIGKDTILEPVKYAIGPWNFTEVSPAHLLGRFNGFVKSVILRISEARDLGDVDRYAFYDHLKQYTAAPPDVLRCDEKNIREHAVMNITGVIITSNHKTDGIYLPADDRRHFVAWSPLSKEDFGPDYFRSLYSWYSTGGIEHVAAFLTQLDLAAFDPKATPPKTAAFHEIVDANRAPEDSELADVLDALENPPAVSLAQITAYADDEFKDWLSDRRNRRQIPHRFEAVGYAPCRNPGATDGLWKIQGKRQAVYALRTLPVRDAIAKAAELVRPSRAN